MRDLIDRTELIKNIKYSFYGYERVRIDTVTGTFLSELCAPTVDAVEVVRCENCQFWDNKHISSEGLAKCVTGESGIRYRRSYDFCSRGVHKEAESE